MKRQTIDYDKRVVFISFSAIVLSVALTLYGYVLMSRVYDVSDSWSEYNEEAKTVSYSLSQLYANVGYGGFIHNLKNYVLRGDITREKYIEDNLENTYYYLEILQNHHTNKDIYSKSAKIIKGVIDEYKEKYQLARQLVSQNMSPTEIDTLIKVNDKPALEALQKLSTYILKYSQLTEKKIQYQIKTTIRYVLFGSLILPLIIIVGGVMISLLRSLSRSNSRLIAAETFSEDMLKVSPEPIIISDENREIILINLRACDLFGYTEDELLGKSIQLLVPHEFRKKHHEQIDYYFKSPRERLMSELGELTAITKDNNCFPVEIALNYSMHEGQKVAISVIRDITERKERESKVQSLLFFERLLSEITATFVNISIAEVPIKINQMLKKIAIFLEIESACIYTYQKRPNKLSLSYMYNSSSMKNSSLFETNLIQPWLFKILQSDELFNITDVDQLKVEAPMEYKYYYGRSLKTILILPSKVSNDTTCALELSTTKSYCWSDELISRVNLLSDFFAGAINRLMSHKAIQLAEKEASENHEKLLHITRLDTMGKFASGLAHEINQPLAAIVGYTEACQRLMAANNLTLEKQQELLTKISNQTIRAGDIISRLRQMVKKEVTEFIIYNVNDVIKDSVKLIDHEIAFHESILVYQLSEKLPEVYIDVVQIQQVILNLIRNAIDAMTEYQSIKKIIKIESILQGKNVEIIVSDTGPGILGCDSLEDIFEPFFGKKSSGLGIGLSICKSIVEAHGGQIWAENIKFRFGARIHFTLPGIYNE